MELVGSSPIRFPRSRALVTEPRRGKQKAIFQRSDTEERQCQGRSYATGETMVSASERYVHFLVDLSGRPPQRCRVSLRALAALEGSCPFTTELDQATRLFLKHRRLIEAVARMKLSKAKDPAKWLTIAVDDVDLRPKDRTVSPINSVMDLEAAVAAFLAIQGRT